MSCISRSCVMKSNISRLRLISFARITARIRRVKFCKVWTALNTFSFFSAKRFCCIFRRATAWNMVTRSTSKRRASAILILSSSSFASRNASRSASIRAFSASSAAICSGVRWSPYSARICASSSSCCLRSNSCCCSIRSCSSSSSLFFPFFNVSLTRA